MSAPDVVLVGGGLIGMLTAAELAERGARVIVLEKDDVGFEQSGRSVAAVNLPGGPAPSPTSAATATVPAQCFGCLPMSGCRSAHGGTATFTSTPRVGTSSSPTIRTRSGWPLIAPPGRRPPDTPTARRSMRRRPGSAFRSWLARFVRSTPGPADMSTQSGSCLACAPSPIAWASRCAAAPSRPGSRLMVSKSLRSARGGTIPCGIAVVAAGMWSPDLCDVLGFHIPMQRVRAPAAQTGPVPANTIPGFLRASTFGARQNRDGTIRITGGYRYSAMLHDLSFRDLRDIRVGAPLSGRTGRTSPCASVRVSCRMRLDRRGNACAPDGTARPSRHRGTNPRPAPATDNSSCRISPS